MPPLPPLDLVAFFFALLIISLSVHEAAHAFASDRLGDPTARMLGRLTLNPLRHIDVIGTVVFPLLAIISGFPLLGWAKPVPVNMRNLRRPRWDFAMVALAGPVSNIVLAIIARLLLGAFDSQLAYDPISVRSFLVKMIDLNVLLAAFNLLPIPPLDGGNVLAGLVPESLARVIDQIRPWGFLILYALLFTGQLFVLVNPIRELLFGLLGSY